MAKLWSSSEGVTQLALVLQAIVILLSLASFFVTMRKTDLERASKRESSVKLAEAQENAEKARLETARLNAILMPIDLTPDQLQVLTRACRRFAGKAIQIRANSPDPESWLLADLIAGALKGAGLNVERQPMKGVSWESLGPGMVVGGADQELVSGLKSDLEEVGNLYVSISSNEPSGMNFISLGVRPFVLQ